MKISQETYDETLLENEDVFSLSPSEAIEETISQFVQQGIPREDLTSYIVITHPSSEEGKEERTSRSVFTSLLETLDSYIDSQGHVILNDSANGDGEDNSNLIVGTIDQIHAYYDRKEPIPFLNLTHSSSSMFTFMNLLSIIRISKIENNIETSKNESNDNASTTTTDIPSKGQINILHAILKLLITILCPKHKNEKEIKTMFKDSFVCMERMVGLIVHYMTLLLLQNGTNNKENSERNESNESNNDENHCIIETLTLVIQCIMNACKNCEKNKVLFVRCLKAVRVSESIGVMMDHFHSLKLSSSLNGLNTIHNNNTTQRGETKNKQKESTIGILSNLITLSLELYHHYSEETKSSKSCSNHNQTNELLIILITECCKLISVLCRFDDFRTNEESNSQASLVDSSYGGVSSAHDHVLEFNREGVIPTLHQVILLSLGDTGNATTATTTEEDIFISCPTSSNNKKQNKFSVGLAAAAMSATRVLAVNDEIVQALVAVGILKSVKIALDMGVVELELESEIETKFEADDEQNGDVDLDKNDINDINDEKDDDDKEGINSKKLLFIQRQQLTSGAVGLIRNLCGNDEIKTTLCLGSNSSKIDTSSKSTSVTKVPSALPSIIQAMSIYKKSSSIQEHGCGALAAMALRKPSNALRILHQDGASSILTAMKLFPNSVLVQRQGALAVRNIVSRLVANTSAVEAIQENGVVEKECNENEDTSNNASNSISVRDIFLDLGAEVILRGITGRHQGSVDEAYAALRDLGCQVSMVKYDAKTQTATTRTVMFGDVKPKFRPVYNESD